MQALTANARKFFAISWKQFPARCALFLPPNTTCSRNNHLVWTTKFTPA